MCVIASAGAMSEMKAATLKTKVQQLDEKERLRRLRMQAIGSQAVVSQKSLSEELKSSFPGNGTGVQV
eukprot:1158354-Pelagomonas_calceolata.AAC.2